MASIILVQIKPKPAGPKSKKQDSPTTINSMRLEVFSSLQGFVDAYPLYNIWSMRKVMTRMKRPYEDEKLVVMRVKLNQREK